ncbi:MAG: FG-GAP-like repeat-containing protein [Phycisphaerales bacterium]
MRRKLGVVVVGRSGVLAVGVALCVAGASRGGGDGGPGQFYNATVSCGITSVHQPSGPFIFSIYNYAPMIAGGAVGDFNRDGFQDIFVVCSGGHFDALYINNGDGTFTNQASAWGVAKKHMGIGATAGDYDGDGWPDLFITSLGNANTQPAAGKHLLYRNNGNGTFSEVAAQAGVKFTSPTSPDGFGSCFGDVNRDGLLDLFTASWASNTMGNRLFLNNGDGTFTDSTGPGGSIQVPGNVRGFTPIIADMTGDGWAEVLLAADFSTSKGYTNQGDGTFVDTTASMGLGLDANGMGAAVGDLTGDGLPDYFVTSIHSDAPGIPQIPGTGNMLYINQGDGEFAEESLERGVKFGWWGWGSVFVDVDNDGDLDIVMVNGWHGPNSQGEYEYSNRPAQLYINDGTGYFTEQGAERGLDHVSQGRGVAVIDIDNDGAQDIVIFSHQSATALYRNALDTEANRYLRIRFETGRHACIPPDGLHTRVRARVGDVERVRTLHSGDGYLTASESVMHIGFGAAQFVDELVVEWPNGESLVMFDVPTNQFLTIEAAFEGDADGDGEIGMEDLALTIEQFAMSGVGLEGDANNDGIVDSDDLSIVLMGYGRSCWFGGVKTPF